MKNLFLAFFALSVFVFSACSPTYLEGAYRNYVPENTISFVNENYQFTKDGGFVYKFFSDDISGNKYGEGQYIIAGNQLTLTYQNPENNLSEATYEDFYGEEYPGDSLIMLINLKLPSGTPLAGVVVYFFQGVEECLPPVVTNAEGQAKIRTTKDMIPFRLETQALGLTPFSYTIADPYHWRVDATLTDFFGKIYTTEDDATVFKLKLQEPNLWLKDDRQKQHFVRNTEAVDH